MHNYFGRFIPSLQVRAPHVPSYLNGGSSEEGGVSMSLGMLFSSINILLIGLMTEHRPPLDTPALR